jgi:hypothetical protein
MEESESEFLKIEESVSKSEWKSKSEILKIEESELLCTDSTALL